MGRDSRKSGITKIKICNPASKKVKHWQKRWFRNGRTSMKIYGWVLVPDPETTPLTTGEQVSTGIESLAAAKNSVQPEARGQIGPNSSLPQSTRAALPLNSGQIATAADSQESKAISKLTSDFPVLAMLPLHIELKSEEAVKSKTKALPQSTHKNAALSPKNTAKHAKMMPGCSLGSVQKPPIQHSNHSYVPASDAGPNTHTSLAHSQWKRSNEASDMAIDPEGSQEATPISRQPLVIVRYNNSKVSDEGPFKPPPLLYFNKSETLADQYRQSQSTAQVTAAHGQPTINFQLTNAAISRQGLKITPLHALTPQDDPPAQSEPMTSETQGISAYGQPTLNFQVTSAGLSPAVLEIAPLYTQMPADDPPTYSASIMPSGTTEVTHNFEKRSKQSTYHYKPQCGGPIVTADRDLTKISFEESRQQTSTTKAAEYYKPEYVRLTEASPLVAEKTSPQITALNFHCMCHYEPPNSEPESPTHPNMTTITLTNNSQPVSETKSTSESDSDAESTSEPDSDAESTSEPDSDAESTSESVSETESTSEAVSETESTSEPVSETESTSEPSEPPNTPTFKTLLEECFADDSNQEESGAPGYPSEDLLTHYGIVDSSHFNVDDWDFCFTV